MPSSYTDLGIELMATGENSGTWGDKTNTNLNINSIKQFCWLSGKYLLQGELNTTALAHYGW
jgi:hypothetical protein